MPRPDRPSRFRRDPACRDPARRVALALAACLAAVAAERAPAAAQEAPEAATATPATTTTTERAPSTPRRPWPRPVDVAAPDPGAADLFAMAQVTAGIRRALAAAQADEVAAGAAALDALITAHPQIGLLRANRAALHMRAGEPEAAQAALTAAGARGFQGIAALLEDPLFAPLGPAARDAVRAIAPAAPPPAPIPAEVTRGRARVDAGNTAWNPATERYEPRFLFSSPAPDTPVVPARRTAAHEILREHARRGRAAGNHGDLYDNRDRGHARLARGAHPQLAHVIYSPAARAADLDYGLADALLFAVPTLGNSSTALTGGAAWRSLPRAALTRPDGSGPARLHQSYAANQLYVYPAHRDFSPEFGDILPANTPYLLISRGSSGSDQPFLEAVAMILAAFRPETKARLAAEGLIAPTVQMVFRRSLQGIRSRAAYLSGAAHPAAFSAAEINLARMVSLANAIAADEIPPMVRLRMVAEDAARPGIDYFGDGLSEVLFDTPSAIGRLWRSKAWSRSYTLSAAQTRDPNGRPLVFDWRLLQGDPARVRIAPFDGGRQARVTLDWQAPHPVEAAPDLQTARIDIGVFAANGVHDSAPAIFSVQLPAAERRRYAAGPDGIPRIAEIDHTAPVAYADPMLVARADWRDTFAYDADGPAGWTRRRGDAVSEFTAEGARILGRDAAGQPLRTDPTAYPLHRTADGTLRVEERSAR